MGDFKSLNLRNWIIAQLNEIGLKKATPVQKACIPEILADRDCIGVAKTGSGKTLAFVLPILQTLSEDPYGIYAVVLTPTRELANQINDQFNIIGVGMGLRTCLVIGGVNMINQYKDLDKRPHVVIATPGRLADHIEYNSTLSLSKVKYLVIDEADRLLDPNEESTHEQLTTIVTALPSKRQTLLFTATNSEAVTETIAACPNNPFVWIDESVGVQKTVHTLDQRFILTPNEAKNGFLVQLILETREKNPQDSMMIFVDTCKMAEQFERAFRRLGIECICLHGKKVQKERDAALDKFKSSQMKVLIATDVASRGLDIPLVNMVINHSVPRHPPDYVHRVGRTARAGRGGMSVTLLVPSQIALLKAIETETKVMMQELKINEEKVAEIILQVNSTLREADIEMEFDDWNERKEIQKRVKLLTQGKDPEKVKAQLDKRRKEKIKKDKRELKKLIKKAKKNETS